MPTRINQFAASLILLVLVFLASCSSNTSTQSVQSVGGNRNKLIIYIVGFTEKLETVDAVKKVYGSENTFYGKNGIQPYLAQTQEFKNAQSMVFSYAGFHGDGKPNPFTCNDTTTKKIADEARLLHDQINAYLATHKNTDVYLVSHSLGGVIAFAYTGLMIEGDHNATLENGGFLKGVSINDSPLGGVSSSWGYTILANGVADVACKSVANASVIHELQQLYDKALDKKRLGESASIVSLLKLGTTKTNQEVAIDAANDGVSIIVTGSSSDILWQPDLCNVSPAFLSTEYLNDLEKIGSGAIYVRSFWVIPTLDINECSSKYIAASHGFVTTEESVKQAIWEAFTNRDVHNDTAFTVVKDGKGVDIVLTPIPIPKPTPVPQATLTTGTWSGTEVINGVSRPDLLIVESVTGTTFTGTWGIAGPGNSASPIQEGVTTGNVVNFKTSTQLMDQYNVYGGTITGNILSGNLVTYDNQVGTFSLTKS